ncbi:MAG: tetratricopeptide repeat protein [Acidobacteria bacterium]|nr:tetratricopeptide repeat protein [Acidobacteriota bacterium]
MFRTNHFFKGLFSLLAVVSINLQSVPTVRANDIVATEDVVSGSSVFVFRESRKKPQERAGGSIGIGGSRKKSYRETMNAQIAAARKKKADAARARAALVAKARAKERLAKLKLSNTLAAAAEKKMGTGDVAGAIVDYRGSLKANPKNAESISGLSEALTATGIQTAGEDNNEAAVPMFNEAVKLDPKNEVAFTKLGEIHDARGRNALAITNYEKALAIDPELSSLYLPVALAYVEAGNAVKADLYLTRAESSGAAGTDAKMARGVLLYKQNKNAEALAVFDQIAAAEPQNGAVQYQRAVLFDKLGQPDKAIDTYKKATQMDPGYAPAWFDLGVIYYNKGDYKNALTAYQSAVKADNANAKAHANLASTYRQLERYPEANAEYKIASETIKDDPNLYSEWGFCLGKTAEWDNATARLETAKGMSPTAEDESNVGWAYYNAAQTDKAAKNDAAAAEKLEKGKVSLQAAVQKDPNLDAAHMNLGSTYNSLGEHDKAVVSLNEAVRLHNDWVIALNQLGLAYRGTNNLSAALNSFNRVVVLDGNNVSGLFGLGSTQYATGDKNAAKKTQAKLKKIRPDLADQLGSIIAGKAIEYGTQKLKEKVRIPGIPF